MFSFPLYRAYAEDSSSVKQDPRTDPSEEEEEESSGSEGRKAVASGDEEAQPEGKKKKRSGFRDRKVLNLGVLCSRCTAVEKGRRLAEHLIQIVVQHVYRIWLLLCTCLYFLRDLTVLGTYFLGMLP